MELENRFTLYSGLGILQRMILKTGSCSLGTAELTENKGKSDMAFTM